MADLISRAAAIEAIKPLLYSGNSVSTLINMPAMDAIPVDWIRRYAATVGSRVRAEIVREMLNVWEKGQEGKT